MMAWWFRLTVTANIVILIFSQINGAHLSNVVGNAVPEQTHRRGDKRGQHEEGKVLRNVLRNVCSSHDRKSKLVGRLWLFWHEHV